MHSISRRQFLQATALGSVAIATGALPSRRAFAADTMPVSWANLAPGFTTLVTDYIRAKNLDKKNGFNIAKPRTYTSVPTYYADFVAGTYDVCIGSWDSFAARYLRGVPIQLVCTITTGSMINIVTPKSGAKDVKELVGKILAAPTSTGTYRITNAVIKSAMGIDLASDMKVQNVNNPAAAVTLVRANRADGALSWEPDISKGLAEDRDLRVIFSTGEAYKRLTGAQLPYFAVAVRQELLRKEPRITQKIDGMFHDAISGINADNAKAIQIAGDRTGTSPEVLKQAMSSGRLAFTHHSMLDSHNREIVSTAARFLRKNKLLPDKVDSGFYAKS